MYTDNAVSAKMGSCYQDVLKLIHMQVNRFVGNGVIYDREQALSDANLAFVKAYHNFEPEKSEFTTHVGFRVHMKILSEFRRMQRNPRPITFSELDEKGKDQVSEKASTLPDHEKHERPKWFDFLTEDAKMVIDLVLYPTKDILLFFNERTKKRTSSYRSCVKEYLLCIGWDKKRVSTVFDEIKEVIRVT